MEERYIEISSNIFYLNKDNLEIEFIAEIYTCAIEQKREVRYYTLERNLSLLVGLGIVYH